MEVVDALIGDQVGAVYSNLGATPALGTQMSPAGLLYGNTHTFAELEGWSGGHKYGKPVRMPGRSTDRRR